MSTTTVSRMPGEPGLSLPGAAGRWAEEWREHGALVRALFWRRYWHRYAGTAGGVFWVLVMPCVPLFVYTSLQYLGVFNTSTQNLPRALFAGWGIVFFFAFADTLRAVAGALVQNRREVLQSGVPKMTVVLVAALQSAADVLVRGLVLAVVAAFMLPHWPSPWLLAAPVGALALVALGFGLGCVLALVAVYYRDALNVLTAFLSYLFFASGVFMRIPVKSGSAAWVFHLLAAQPVYVIIDQSRQLCLLGLVDRPEALVAAVLLCFAAVPIGLTCYYRAESLVNSHL